MAALELRFDIHDILLDALERHVLLLDAGRNVIRFLPPLVIKKTQLERAIQVLDRLIEAKESGIRS
jgi:acetylornithine/succinyldiaminopimelate/putrescine aminotransferase